MKSLALSLLLCAGMVLTRAAHLETRDVVLTSTSTCPGDWMLADDRAFCYVPTAMSWNEAEKNCQKMGADLASVHCDDEYDMIQELVLNATSGYPRAWLGGFGFFENNQWVWSDDLPEDCETSSQETFCLQMNNGRDHCWGNIRCSNKLPSVCVRDCEDEPRLKVE